MWRLTLAQMRRSLGRLTAAGIAIAIGTAFVAASILAGTVMQRISYDSITSTLGRADLVADSPVSLTESTVDAVRAQPGVAGADPLLVVPAIALSSGERAIAQAFVAVPSDRAFDTQHVTAGTLPTRDGEITLPERAAERLGVDVGDTVTVSYTGNGGAVAGAEDEDEETAAAATVEERTQTVRVVALTTNPTSAWAEFGGAAMASTADTLLWSGWSVGPPRLVDASTPHLIIAVASGADIASVQKSVAGVFESVAGAVETDGPADLVVTRDEFAERTLSTNGGGAAKTILIVVLSFAAIAVLVAGLVIANTFQVLVAQRTRTLALLRCVGAVRAQVRRSVLLEAGLVGLAASVLGLLLGTGLVQGALWVMQRQNLPFPVPVAVHLTAASVLVPLAVGVAVTVLAALTPARVATRVAPIAALRPSDAPAVGSRAGRIRLTSGIVLVAGGTLMLGGGVDHAASDDLGVAVGVGVAILGGALSFIGLLVGAVFWMPKAVAGIGRLVGRAGMPARLAAANTGRNPARTAATSTALLIGVTLVAMMSTGAASARSTLNGELDTRFPADLQVLGTSVIVDGRNVVEPLPAGTAGRLEAIAGVEAVAVMGTELLHLGGGVDDVSKAVALTPAQATSVLRDAELAGAVGDGTLVVSRGIANRLGIKDGDSVPVALGRFDGGHEDNLVGAKVEGSPTVSLTAVVVRPYDSEMMLVTPGTLDALGSPGTTGAGWIRVSDMTDPSRVMQDVQDATANSGLWLSGSALERAGIQRAIDTLLAVVIGLLAVAVVIALIGVTNTLSLSVIERRRESATLRALGLTRRQLRVSMAVEGALIAGVGALIGAALGLAYGWAGSTAVLSSIGVVELQVPWADLGIMLGVALVAGVLASVVPGRSAARTPPVAALAVD